MINMGLHESQLEALEKERLRQLEELALNTTGDVGVYRFRIGRIRGLVDAIDIIETVRVRMMEG